jgi:hypothetical protein
MSDDYKNWCLMNLRELQGVTSIKVKTDTDDIVHYWSGVELLCRFLRDEGHNDMVDEFEKIKIPRVIAETDLWATGAK